MLAFVPDRSQVLTCRPPPHAKLRNQFPLCLPTTWSRTKRHATRASSSRTTTPPILSTMRGVKSGPCRNMAFTLTGTQSSGGRRGILTLLRSGDALILLPDGVVVSTETLRIAVLVWQGFFCPRYHTRGAERLQVSDEQIARLTRQTVDHSPGERSRWRRERGISVRTLAA